MASITGALSNDVELMFPGDRFPVSAGPTLIANGWRGGIWVMYVTSTVGDFVVEASDGTTASGFLLFQSEQYPATHIQEGSPGNWLAHQPRSCQGSSVVTMVSGGTRAFFRQYETVALAGGTRSGGAITYSLNDALKVSENGLLCNDSDAQLALAGIASPVVVGLVSAVPSTPNENRLGADIKY